MAKVLSKAKIKAEMELAYAAAREAASCAFEGRENGRLTLSEAFRLSPTCKLRSDAAYARVGELQAEAIARGLGYRSSWGTFFWC